MTVQTINESWTKIIAWLQANLPEALNNLRSPATNMQIEEVEKSIGIKFPDALRALYLLHDGETNNWPPSVFDEGHWFMPLSKVVSHRNNMSEFVEATPTDSFANWKSAIEDNIISVKGPVKPYIYSSFWIPFTTLNGDVHRYIDFDPAPTGQIGQVIEHCPEACTHKVLANSFEEYISSYAEQLKSGRFVVIDNCISDTQEDSEESWGIPDYLKGVEYDYIKESDISQPFRLDELEDSKEIELIGQMGFLMGTASEIIFSILILGGQEYSFLATKQDTTGYGAIAFDQYANIRAIKYNKTTSNFTKGFGTKAPEFLALEYKMVKGLDINLGKRPWWKFWH